MSADLRLGKWQEVLADVECDALISDPPYGARTHANQRHGRAQWAADDTRWVTSRGIDYAHFTASDVEDFVAAWAPRTRGWFCVFTSHDLAPVYEKALQSCGRYVFAPIACVQIGMNIRLAGDGPSNWTTWLISSRTVAQHKWGTLPGAYVGNPFDPGQNTATASRRSGVVGSKPLWLMRALVRDYTRPGDLVCDPCAGGGTTLLAALMEGRRAVGAEMMPEHFSIAQKRLARGFTPPLIREERPEPEQAALFAAESEE